MNILALTRHSSSGASSRLRFFQYLPLLEKRGCKIAVAPLFYRDDYLEQLYRGKQRPVASVISSFINRIAQLPHLDSYDVVWLEKEFMPWWPALVEKLFASRCRRLVIDFDDAIFHTYDNSRSWIVTNLLKGKIASVIRCAHVVVTGNEYLAEYAKRAGARRVEVLPTVVDPKRYSTTQILHKTGNEFTVGWIGSPVTEKYLDIVMPALEAVARIVPIKFLVIGARKVPASSIPAEIRPWSIDTETANIADMDVGIMPLPDAPWERGKCGYKLIQYMAAGKPVIASPVGVNEKIVLEGKACGLVATTTEDWQNALLTLACNKTLRSQLANSARNKVECLYSIYIQEERLWHILSDIK